MNRLALPAALCAALLFGAGPAFAQVFSPGELAKPHEHLEGLSNCKQCHGDGEQVSQSKCLDCHKELNQRVRAGKGFHGKMSDDERTCQKCHHEHQGKGFALVDWVPSKKGFPHQKTGWPLEGKHKEVKCEDCHQRRFVVDDLVKALLQKHPSADTHLGLSTKCSACHFDEHRGQLKGACDECHDVSAWKPAKGFSHDDTGYKLTGLHRRVQCKGCHPTVEDTTTSREVFPKPVSWAFFKAAPIDHQSCLDCHEDPHQNRFGQRCESCHTTAGWKTVKTPGGNRAFHDKTRFPLKGLHAEVECKACHGPFPGIPAKFKGLPFSECSTCHADAHEGQLTAAKKGAPASCDSCHTVDGFLPPRFEPVDHDKTRFPLLGAHQAVPCDECHKEDRALEKRIPASVLKDLKRKKRPERFSFARFDVPGKLDECQTCHKDPHAGQFDARIQKDGCTACHEVASWRKLKFDHDKDTQFALTGAHQKTACESCHREERIKGQKVVRYTPVEAACDACHADPHGGQFAKEKGRTGCEACHGTASFKDGLKFVHAPPFTQFLLDGKHAQVKCEACHLEVALGGGKKTRRYVALPTTCEGCHQDYHQGAFKGFVP